MLSGSLYAQPAEALQRAADAYNAANYEEADAQATQVLAELKDEPQALRIRAYSRYMLMQFDKAIDDLTLLLAQQPDAAEIQYLRGEAYMMMSMYDKALPDFEAVATTHSDPHQVQLQIGIAQYELGLTNQAIETLTALTQANPLLADAWFHLGVAEYNRMNYPAALNHYSQAIELDGEFAQARAYRAVLSVELGHGQEVLEDFEKAIALGYENGAMRILYSEQLIEAGRTDDALLMLNNWLNIFSLTHRSSARALTLKGNCLQQQGNASEAADAYKVALAIDESLALARLSYAQCLMQLANWQQANTELDKVLIDIRQNPEPCYLRGLCRVMLQQPEAALGDFSTALEFEAHNPTYLLAMAWCQLATGRAEEAEELLKSGLWHNQQHPQLLLARALAFLQRSYDKAACADIQIALKQLDNASLNSAWKAHCDSDAANEQTKAALVNALEAHLKAQVETQAQQAR